MPLERLFFLCLPLNLNHCHWDTGQVLKHSHGLARKQCTHIHFAYSTSGFWLPCSKAEIFSQTLNRTNWENKNREAVLLLAPTMRTQFVYEHDTCVLHGQLEQVHFSVSDQNKSKARPLTNQITEQTLHQSNRILTKVLVLQRQIYIDVLFMCSIFSE